MSYILPWKNAALPGKTDITVPVAAIVSTATSLVFTGKGAPNYGAIQQTNVLRLLENFADGTAPLYPTLGQTWFNSDNGVLNVCTSISPVVWETLTGVHVSSTAPVNPAVGDMWFEQFSHSGFLYIFTGTGRYPTLNWDAHATGYFPSTSPLTAPFLNVKTNYDSFTNVNFSEAYIHGFTGATPADTDGQIRVDGVLTNVPRGPLYTNLPNAGGILWDTTATLVTTAAGGSHFFSVRTVGDNKWEYDNDSTWVPFLPIAGMMIIGYINVAESDDNTAPGISYAEVWQDAMSISRSTVTLSGSYAAGGWHQMWPTVEFHGARFEYDAMVAQVLQLIGSPYTTGGNHGMRGLDLTDFSTIDASIRALAYNSARDINVGPLDDATLVAGEPTSDDWDLLLAAARWALKRLDLPATMLDSISNVPFTQDGRVTSTLLQSLSSNDVRYTPQERRYFRRFGSITASRLFAETMNALSAAITQRYTMKGIVGQNSTITTMNPDVATYTHTSYLANYTGGGAVFNVLYLHGANDQELSAFIASGGAVDIKLDYTLPGSPVTNDTLFQSFINTNNTIRLTADKVRVFSNSLPLTLTQAPTAAGFNDAGTSFVNICTITTGGSSAVIAVVRTGNSLGIRLSLTGPSGISGATSLRWNIIRDTQTFSSDVPFFPGPNPYTSGDNVGTNIVWINQSPIAKPTVNFVANTITGTAPHTATFTYTGTGAPTLIEWDFTGDGTYSATGAVVPGITYNNKGTYMVRCRATNTSGQDILTRPTYITVT